MTEAEAMPIERYEIELRELAYEADDGNVLRITGSTWRPIMVFRADAIPMPLTFARLDEALAYAGRAGRGSVQVVRVTGDGGREVVG